ncbi:hypothetical protein BLX87_05450 [Bacillus sp. VT-16-64]|nr:hypothetical protein BLX87_05450 [Bacillus sp. VT-16-64]
MSTELKTCTRCQQTKPIEEYYGAKRSYCIECERETARERMRKYNATFRGRAMTAWRDAKKAAAKYGVFDDLTANDVMFVFAISHGECSYCGEVTDDYQLEHIVPLSKGGKNTLSNVTCVCKTCNRSKFNHDLLTWQDRSDRPDDFEILTTIERMATRRGVHIEVIFEELKEQAREHK